MFFPSTEMFAEQLALGQETLAITVQGIYRVTNFMELGDVDLTNSQR